MAFSTWLVWCRDGLAGPRRALSLFLVQLVLNAFWSWLFFAWRQGAWAFADIVLLWLAVAATIIAFWRRRPLADARLLPYLAWSTFAAALNYSL